MTLFASRRQAAEHAITLLREHESMTTPPPDGAAAAERRYNAAALEGLVLAVADMTDLETEPTRIVRIVTCALANQLASYCISQTSGNVELATPLAREMARELARIAVDRLSAPPAADVEVREAQHRAGHA